LTAEWARTPLDQRDTSVLFMQVLDAVSDGYRTVIGEVRRRVEALEEELLVERPRLNRVLGDLLELSRDLASVRDGLLPLRADVRELLHLREPIERGMVGGAGLRWLKELLHDLSAEVPAVLDSADRRIESALMQVQGERSEATNRVVFLLTIVTVAFFVPTLLTGLYGMNVPLPAKNDDEVFWVVVGVAAVLLGLAGVAISRLKLWGNFRAVAPDRPRSFAGRFLRPRGPGPAGAGARPARAAPLGGVSPPSSSGGPRRPWSMNRSGRPIRSTRPASSPSTSCTALPNPPTTAWSSTVTTSSCS